MSYVTEVLVYGLDIDKPVREINLWLKENKVNGELLPLDNDAAGGGRPFAMQVFAMAVNYMPIDDFRQFIATVDFGMFEDQLVVLMTTETYPTTIFAVTNK